MRRGGPALTAVVGLAACALLVDTLRLAPASRTAPLWVIVPTLALLVLEVARGLRSGGAGRPEPATRAASGPAPGASVGSGHGAPADARRVARLAGWWALLLGLVYVVGFMAAVPVYLAPYLRVEAGVSWSRALILTGVTSVFFWVTFGLLLRAPFPAPLIG